MEFHFDAILYSNLVSNLQANISFTALTSPNVYVRKTSYWCWNMHLVYWTWFPVFCNKSTWVLDVYYWSCPMYRHVL